MFAIVIYRDSFTKGARKISIKHDMDVFLISLFDRFRGPLWYGTTAGGLDILDHQGLLTRIGKGKIVADLRVEVYRAEIVLGLVEMYLCIILCVAIKSA
jgi:hypothetical protein